MHNDKKALAGKLRFVLSRKVGEVTLFDDVSESDVLHVLEELCV
jgi:3-dehydroquinate synthetase